MNGSAQWMGTQAWFCVILAVFSREAVAFGASPTSAGLVDVVVIGTGAGGSPVAARLAEAFPFLRIVVVERGSAWQDRNPNVSVPLKFIDLQFPPPFQPADASVFDGLKSVPQAYAFNRSFAIAAGNVTGGGTAINGMIALRGFLSDFDKWPPQWSSAHMLPAYKRLENRTGGTPKPDPAWRGLDGPFHLQDDSYPSPLALAYIDAAQAMGVHHNPSFNGAPGDLTGVGKLEKTQDAGARDVSIDAYNLQGHANITLLTNTLATRILLTPDNASVLGIEYVHNGVTKQMMGRRVIVSGGAFYTPQLLQVSGIGPRSVLEAAGVPVRRELDAVGRGLQDHVGAPLVFSLQYSSPFNNATFRRQQWPVYRKGPHTGNVFSFGSVAADMIFHSSGNQSLPADLACELAEVLPWADDLVDRFVSFTLFKLDSKDRGTVKAMSPDMRDPPAVDPMYFSHPGDMKSLTDGIVFVRKVAAQASFAHLLDKEVLPGAWAHSSSPMWTNVVELANKVTGVPALRLTLVDELVRCVHKFALEHLHQQVVLAGKLQVLQTTYSRAQLRNMAASRGFLNVTADRGRLVLQKPSQSHRESVNEWLRQTENRWLELWVTVSSFPGWHFGGTAALGAVVNSSDLQVFGVRGLHVVDASIMPTVARCNTMIPTLAVAERAAELIVASWHTP